MVVPVLETTTSGIEAKAVELTPPVVAVKGTPVTVWANPAVVAAIVPEINRWPVESH